jgi:hypothetical protein
LQSLGSKEEFAPLQLHRSEGGIKFRGSVIVFFSGESL